MREAGIDKDFEINPLVDLPGEKLESDTSIRLDDADRSVDGDPGSSKYVDIDTDPGDNYFGYLCTGKCYRFLREGFLVSTHSRIHQAGFRSRYGVYLERSRHLASFPWIIHPLSTFRWIWEILITLMLLITLARQPILLSYMSDKLTEEGELILSSLLSLLFLFDIVLNFRTGIVNQQSDTVILDPALIAKKYLTTWFLIDILSTIPYDTILWVCMEVRVMDKQDLTFFKYVRLLELLKIFRLSRVIRYFRRHLEAYVMNSLYIRVINLHIVIFFTLHWIACMHYLVADMFNDDGHNPKSNTWVTQLDLWEKPVFIKYINSVIRALSNMACLGYGNEVPREPEDIICTITSIMIGATFFALFVGNLSSILINMDVAQKKYAEVLNQVMEYMRFKQIPKELQHRVILYYEQRYRRNFFNENVILENVSDVLRKELLMFNCRSLVESVPLFQGMPVGIIQGVVSRLKFEVYLPQDIIINTHTLGDSMYFIEHGAVSILSPSGRAVAQLRDGDFFGEMSLITNERRNATVVATSFCDVYRLSREDFEEVVGGYPEIYAHLVELTEQRAVKINQQDPLVQDKTMTRFKDRLKNKIGKKPHKSAEDPL